MSDTVYICKEYVGTSKKSIEDAINNALSHAHGGKEKACWFEVIETRGHVIDGKADYFQVIVKVGLNLE